MLEAGHLINHFKIISLLGSGGMGEVYLAEDTKLQRQVALKILHADFFADDERRQRFIREARSAAGISHPNVMSIYDQNSFDDPVTGRKIDYIVMEYIDGQSLTALLREKVPDIKSILRIAEKIASGLSSAHKLNIVHRDIKPDNIIIDKDDNPRILDFGLAKLGAIFEDETKDVDVDTISEELTRTGKIVGTVSYMSPEQIQGEKIDHRSDIFSFGILLYRMAAGRLPFEGDTQVSTMAKVLEAVHERPHLQNENIPPELERIIDKCLHKNREDRYQDTRDLLVDLRNLRRSIASSITGPVTAITDRPARKKGKALIAGGIWVAAALVVIVIIAAAIKSVGTSAEKPEIWGNGLAILDFDNKTNSENYSWLETGLPEILQTDLAQNRSITIISRDRVVDYLGKKGEAKQAAGYPHESCLKAAVQLGANHALFGTFYKLGENDIRIDARLEDLKNGQLVFTTSVVGANPLVLVDSLTRKLVATLDFEDQLSGDVTVASVTSSSPEAYKLYHLGMEKYEIGLYDDAIEYFKKAIEIDSTFALPYMRIGMAYVFQSIPQTGMKWFAEAMKFQDRLPVREKNLLDIYADIWLDTKLNDAFAKLATLVTTYPKDKEARTIYGLMLNLFTKDTVRAFAQLDTALSLDQGYILALGQYANIYATSENFEMALKYAKRARQAHPDSPGAWLSLAGVLVQMKNYDEAATEYAAYLEKYPGNQDALSSLNRLYIFKRDFARAREMLDEIKKYQADDPFKMLDYYSGVANLYLWQGKFKKYMDYRFEYLRAAKEMGDSNYVNAAYQNISSFYENFDMFDSSLYYAKISVQWATTFQGINYPLTAVTIDPANLPLVEDEFRKELDNFKTRLPSEIWGLANGIEHLFYAYAHGDTAKIISSYQEIYRANPGQGEANLRNAGIFAAKYGDYKTARELLEKYSTDVGATSSGFYYPFCVYHMGLVNEGQGNTEEAIADYREMLKYWDKADIEFSEIRDARARLSRLTAQSMK